MRTADLLEDGGYYGFVCLRQGLISIHQARVVIDLCIFKMVDEQVGDAESH